MHKTLAATILGHLDTLQCHYADGELHLKTQGWAACATNTFKITSFTIEINSTPHIYLANLPTVERPDVSKYYATRPVPVSVPTQCGWNVVSSNKFDKLDTTKDTIKDTIKVCINAVNEEGESYMIFSRTITDIVTMIEPAINPNPCPTFVVIDDIYVDPNQVRDFALSQQFKEHTEYHKGKRTDSVFRFPGLKQRFELAIGKKITNWEKYGINGCFQYCTAEDALVYHTDQQSWAGVLFLTPDAPTQCGTTIFRPLARDLLVEGRGLMITRDNHPKVFSGGFYDKTRFEPVDVVGNMYNRVLLFNAKMIHAASQYFGNDVTNSRLFQMFFFDVEE